MFSFIFKFDYHTLIMFIQQSTVFSFCVTIKSFISVSAFVRPLATAVNMCVYVFLWFSMWMKYFGSSIIWFIWWQCQLKYFRYVIGICTVDLCRIFMQLFGPNCRISRSRIYEFSSNNRYSNHIFVTCGMFTVNLNMFFATLKGVYSLLR